MADFLNRIFDPVRQEANKPGGIISRYPNSVDQTDDPFVLFTKHKAQYNTRGGNSRVDLITTDHVSLYMPMAFSINDNAVFETAATGVAGGAAAALISGTNPANVTQADVTAIAMNSAESLGTAAGGLAGSAVPGRVGGIVGGILGAVGAGSVAQAAAQEYNKKAQVAVNPREFMLYKSPGMRNFSFNFRFIPDDEGESRAAEEIVKWFRRGMYPTAAGQYSFNFPDAFQIEIKNMDGMPKLPEVFLESCNVSFNPNSMSYFKQGNRPVEIVMALAFKELQPITRENINEGF